LRGDALREPVDVEAPGGLGAHPQQRVLWTPLSLTAGSIDVADITIASVAHEVAIRLG